jgi:hypothetical protein
MEFTILPLNEDPLKGRFGLSWFERKPSSLSPDEWRELDQALRDHTIPVSEYTYWKLNVR